MLRLALLLSFLLLAAVPTHAAPPHGTSIAADAIEQRLLAELGARQKLGRVQLDLDNPALHLAVPPGAAATLAVENLDFDPLSGRLVAFVAAPADDPEAE